MKATARKRISKLVLRGQVMEAWLRRKSRKLEQAYTDTLLGHSKMPPVPRAAPSLRSNDPLKTMLFIGDFQWEVTELVPELRKICEVELLDLHPCLPADLNQSAAAVTRAIEKYIQEHPRLNPQIIFFYGRSALHSEETFEMIRKRWPCRVIGMNLDDKIEFLDYNLFTYRNDDYQKWARRFDLNLSNVRAVVDWYADQGLPVYYMPEGFHPRNPPPKEAANFRHEITFVGSWRSERATLVQELRERGVPIEVMGSGWPDARPCQDPAEVYRASMINLGVGFASPSMTLTTVKARDFECPGAGACYLTTYNWELGFHYEIGREILCYRSVEELIEIFSFYRRRPAECLKIARAAYERCHREHTWEKRFRELFDAVGILVAKRG